MFQEGGAQCEKFSTVRARESYTVMFVQVIPKSRFSSKTVTAFLTDKRTLVRVRLLVSPQISLSDEGNPTKANVAQKTRMSFFMYFELRFLTKSLATLVTKVSLLSMYIHMSIQYGFLAETGFTHHTFEGTYFFVSAGHMADKRFLFCEFLVTDRALVRLKSLMGQKVSTKVPSSSKSYIALAALVRTLSTVHPTMNV